MLLRLETNLWTDLSIGRDYMLACGDRHSVSMQTGRLYVCGDAQHGKLGKGGENGFLFEDTPSVLSTISTALQVGINVPSNANRSNLIHNRACRSHVEHTTLRWLLRVGTSIPLGQGITVS